MNPASKQQRAHKKKSNKKLSVSERLVSWMMVRWTRRKLKWFRRGWALSKVMIKNPRVRRRTVRGGKSILRVTGRSLLVLGSTYRVKVAKEFKSMRATEMPMKEKRKSRMGWFEWMKQLVRFK